MPGFFLHSGNRLEALMDGLADLLEDPLPSPLESEIILVQSRGMERWVSMELANRHGICANVRFPFPNSYIGELFGSVLPPAESASQYAPEIMCWHIMGALPGFLGRESFQAIRGYLAEGQGDFKLYQLSRKIADVFDQYLLFRPEMVLKWEASGADRNWQAELWRHLSGTIGGPHRAALLKAFLEKTEREGPARGLPSRISVFGISALPPFHMRVLAAVSRSTDVHLFVMNPCREYWGDIMSGREMRRVKRRARAGTPGGDLHLEKGNGLLASLGMLGRDFFDLLQDLDCIEMYGFRDPGRESLLRSVQADILDLREGPPEGTAPLAPDGSIEVHSCHSPMREVEVLQDNLLAMFESRPDIRPRDVLVMAPDIGTYAPFIEAGFSLPDSDPRMVPFGIADKGLRIESRTISSFLGMLELPLGRLEAGRVMEILDSEEIRDKFGLSAPDVETIRDWVRDSGIRWGLDRSHRESLGIPGFAQNTWRAGLDRMLLGCALPEKEGALFAGTLPFEGIEGNLSEVLGRFLLFTEKLFDSVFAMKEERTLSEWSVFLRGVLEDFLPDRDDTSADLDILREALLELKKFGAILERKIGLDIVRDHLKSRLDTEGFGGRFLSGGITFCAMLPMRSIPFKVICLLGMDDGAYPRDSRPPGFDLAARERRPGDRSRRLDDRYLFLETLLSAREKLYLSYVGQDIRDNSPRPPSVLVSELLDYLARAYGRGDLTVKHALQAFSPRYFRGGELFSYSRENFAAARALARGQFCGPAFFTSGLSEPGAEFRTVSVDGLCSFFRNPAKFLLTRRLGLFLDERPDVLEEREPFEVKGLDKYRLEGRLLEKALQGGNIRSELPRLRAGGYIPPGAPGECWFEDTCDSIERLARRVAALRAGGALDPVRIDLEISGFKVSGIISGLYPGGLIRHQVEDRERDRVSFWITHIILDCALRKGGKVPALSALCTGKLDCNYGCPPDSMAVLEELLDIYWQGLKRPAPFFPRTSWAFAEALRKGRKEPAEQARGKWESDENYGDSDDPYVHKCFADSDPLESAEFRELAVRILRPALEHGNFKSHK